MSAVLDQAHDLEKLLLEHDVTVFGYERLGDLAVVRFTMNDRKLRLVVTMPDWNDDKYRLTPVQRTERSMTQRRQMYWSDVKQTWGAMTRLISAKLHGIEFGITTFEAEFGQFDDASALLGTGTEGVG